MRKGQRIPEHMRERLSASWTAERKVAFRAIMKTLKRKPKFSAEELASRRRAQKKAYAERNHEVVLERTKKWGEDNKERKKACNLEWPRANRASLNARRRETGLTDEQKVAQRDYERRHRAENREYYRTKKHNRRAAEAALGTHTTEEWLLKVAEYGCRCTYCGAGCDLTRDHDVPISRGGSNFITNIVPACITCNKRKYKLTGDEFRARLMEQAKAA